MLDMYASQIIYEQCAPDKGRIRFSPPYAVIHYVFSGYGYINGKKITRGSAFIAAKDCYLDYYPDKTDPWAYIFVRLHGKDADLLLHELGFTGKSMAIPFDRYDELWNLQVFSDSIKATESEDGRKIVANALYLLHQGRPEDATLSSIQNENVIQVRKYIDEHFHTKITVSDIADRFGLSKNYMRNLFVQYFDVSPKAYMQKKRMERARELLLETNLNISLIALSVGYEDALLFSKMFSRHFGISPRNYRQKYRASE